MRKRRSGRNTPGCPASRAGVQTEPSEPDVILCVGGPPELRRLLTLRRAGRVVVIRDLALAWSYLAKNAVNRVLLNVALLANPLAPSPAPARNPRRRSGTGSGS